MFKKLFVLLFALVLFSTTGCEGVENLFTAPGSSTPTTGQPPVVQTVVVEVPVEVEKIVERTVVVEVPVANSPTATRTSAPAMPTATPAATETEPVKPQVTDTAETSVPVTGSNVAWTQVQVALYSEGYQVDGQLWELPLGTHFAATTENGRYEAIPSAPVGVVGKTDHGWCAEDQLDCPPHALLVRVEVPAESMACVKALMDISWRIMIENECGTPVPVRISIRHNDQTRTASEQREDYLALAGLEQEVQNATSEVGLFVSVKSTGMNKLTFLNKEVTFGYSCWDCLADTQGVGEPQPVPLVGDNFSTFGPDTATAGSTMLPGIVFPLSRTANELTFELLATTDTVVWAGRYDVVGQGGFLTTPVAPSATPTPTATPVR